jgi:hypothetical protein
MFYLKSIAAIILFGLYSVILGVRPRDVPVVKVSLEHLGKLAILELVDLNYDKTVPIMSSKLRSALKGMERWQVLSKSEMDSTLANYSKSSDVACNNTQCSFDLGSLIQCQYLLYGAATRINTTGVITLKLMNIQAAKIVWSRVITAPSKGPLLDTAFASVARDLMETDIDILKKKSSGDLIALINFGKESTASKIFFESLLTQSYGNSVYDIMSPIETEELMTALEIKKEELQNSDFALQKAGKLLGVKAILLTSSHQVGIFPKRSIALFDIEEKTLLLHMPSLPKATIEMLLFLEKVFFDAFEDLYNKPISDINPSP